jgi:hypothetical protein
MKRACGHLLQRTEVIVPVGTNIRRCIKSLTRCHRAPDLDLPHDILQAVSESLPKHCRPVHARLLVDEQIKETTSPIASSVPPTNHTREPTSDVWSQNGLKRHHLEYRTRKLGKDCRSPIILIVRSAEDCKMPYAVARNKGRAC